MRADFLEGYELGKRARKGRRIANGNSWQVDEFETITAPDGRTAKGKGFWAAIRGEEPPS